MVSMWFWNETNLVVMIDLLRTVKEELKLGSPQTQAPRGGAEVGSESTTEASERSSRNFSRL